jgi:ComF family protein
LAFVRARAAVEYDQTLRRVVAAWKERGLRRLAGWAAELIVECLAIPDAVCLVHVPGDPDRRLKRGHHAAERLARELSAAWELPLKPLLMRARGSRRQRGLTQLERRRNVAAAFLVQGPVPARVALVDDVYTTGATVNAAASALRQGGARRVEVVTFARTIRIR